MLEITQTAVGAAALLVGYDELFGRPYYRTIGHSVSDLSKDLRAYMPYVGQQFNSPESNWIGDPFS